MDTILLQANEWVFLTLGAGLTLDPGDQVRFKIDLGQRTLTELGSKVTQVGGVTNLPKLAYSNFEIIPA